MAQWIPGPFLALFMGATWITRGYMVTMLPVRGTFQVGDAIEVIWPGGDSILLEVASVEVESRYQPAAIEDAHRRRIPLRRPVIVAAPEDERLALTPGAILTVPEDAPHWPDSLRSRLRVAPAGVLLAAPGSLTHEKLSALPPPAQRTFHNVLALVRQGIL
ncbi:MAG: hypothetical protein Kow00120_17330 [Anaerolineae bacterium]